MTTDEQWLRDRMAAVVDAEPPAVDLAARAERTAGRIRRRRWAGVAGVAAAVVAAPLLLGGVTGPDRSLPPARRPDPACAPFDQALPTQPDAISAADVTWPYRGDPALRPALDRVIAGSVATEPGQPLPVTRPLYAARLAEPAGSAVFVFALQLPGATLWQVVARVLPADARGDLSEPPGDPSSAARLPQLRADTQVSLLVPVEGGTGPLPATGWDRYGNLLVALGTPRADRVEYRACYRGRPFTVTGTGDVLVRAVGPVDAPGEVRVLAGRRLLAAGEVGRPLFGLPLVVRPAVEPVPVPAGTREVQRLRGQGEPAAPANAAATVPAATLLARCRGAVPLEVAVADRPLGRVPCDDAVHVLAEGVALEQGRPLVARGVPELRGGPDVPVAYDVAVVTAG